MGIVTSIRETSMKPSISQPNQEPILISRVIIAISKLPTGIQNVTNTPKNIQTRRLDKNAMFRVF